MNIKSVKIVKDLNELINWVMDCGNWKWGNWNGIFIKETFYWKRYCNIEIIIWIENFVNWDWKVVELE